MRYIIYLFCYNSCTVRVGKKETPIISERYIFKTMYNMVCSMLLKTIYVESVIVVAVLTFFTITNVEIQIITLLSVNFRGNGLVLLSN